MTVQIIHDDEASKPEITLPMQAWVLNGITWLPHYSRRDEFVSPGYGRDHMDRRTSDELLKLGARPVEMMLWPRAKARRAAA